MHLACLGLPTGATIQAAQARRCQHAGRCLDVVRSAVATRLWLPRWRRIPGKLMHDHRSYQLSMWLRSACFLLQGCCSQGATTDCMSCLTHHQCLTGSQVQVLRRRQMCWDRRRPPKQALLKSRHLPCGSAGEAAAVLHPRCAAEVCEVPSDHACGAHI